MKTSILFNWPPGKDRACISVSRETIKDKEYKFTVGVVLKGERDKISWLRPDSIINNDNKFKFNAQKGDIVVVDIIKKSGERKRTTWDIQKEWPEKATGAISIDIPWTFN